MKIYRCGCGAPLYMKCVAKCAECGLPVHKCKGMDCLLSGEIIAYEFREHPLTDALLWCPDCGERLNYVPTVERTKPVGPLDNYDIETLRKLMRSVCRSPK